MASKGITIRAVQALKPGETIWDAGHNEAVRGFGIRRQRGDAVYVIKYRVFGRQRFVTIGRHGSCQRRRDHASGRRRENTSVIVAKRPPNWGPFRKASGFGGV